MRLESLALRGFRNYAQMQMDCCPGVNLLVGDNAQGKTNLLEAIGYLSSFASFRTRREAELIGFGQDFAELSARVQTARRELNLRALLFAGQKRRQLFCNDVKKKSAEELRGCFTTVLFCPEDLQILRAGAAVRRRFVDAPLCQLRPGYGAALAEYTRLLEHKSRILKDRLEYPSLLDTLPDFNERMARQGAVIIRYRARYLRQLAALAGEYHSAFSGRRETLALEYRTVSSVSDPCGSLEDICRQLREHQQSHAAAELASCQCLSGPHRDDFDALLSGCSLKSFGSQGQTRTAAISLKLAERELFRRDTGEEPVLLLDDVLSELDAGRQDFVLNELKSGQVFITCCETDRLTSLGQVFLVQQGTVEPMK